MPIEAIVIPTWQVGQVPVDAVELIERPLGAARLPLGAAPRSASARVRTSANSAATKTR